LKVIPGKLAIAGATRIQAVEPFWMPVFTGMTARHPVTVQIMLVPVR